MEPAVATTEDTPKMEQTTGQIDGISFDTRLSLVDNIANLVTKEKQVLILQLEEKTRQLKNIQSQLTTVQTQYNKLETYVSDQNEDAHSAWQRVGKSSSTSQRASLAKAWFAGTDNASKSGRPQTNSTQQSVDHLSLAYQKLEPTQLSTLRKQVPLLPQLTSLDLTQTGLTDEDVVSIVDFFNPKCGLKEIKLSKNLLGVKAFKSITACLKTDRKGGSTSTSKGSTSSKGLERLDLSNNPFAKAPKTGAALGDALKGNTTLKSLTVTLDDVATLRSQRGASYIGNATQLLLQMYHSPTLKNHTLIELCLTGATLSTQTMEALGKGHGTALRSLTSLDLSSSLIGPTGTFELVNSICNVRPRKDCKLQILILKGNALGDQGACELAHLLRHNRTIKEIDIRCNQINEKGAVALGSALENDVVLFEPKHLKKKLYDGGRSSRSSSSRMSNRRNNNRETKEEKEKRKKKHRESRRMPHVISTLLLGSNPFNQNGGEAILDACRKCMSLRNIGELSPTVPAALRQEIQRVLRENLIESKETNVDCGVLAYGQTSVLPSTVVTSNADRNIDEEGEDEDKNDSSTASMQYPKPNLHTYPWVVETSVPALKSTSNSVGNGGSGGSSGSSGSSGRGTSEIDWRGWYRHYNVFLYRTSPATWDENGSDPMKTGMENENEDRNGEGEGEKKEKKEKKQKKKMEEYRGLDIEFEGFATCTTDPLHRLALDGGNNTKATSGNTSGNAPRTTSLCYRIVRQTNNKDFPHPGLIVKEDIEARDDDDGLLYNIRLQLKDTFKQGDRLSVWIKPMQVSPTETANLYTRNFYVRLPTDEWDQDYTRIGH